MLRGATVLLRHRRVVLLAAAVVGALAAATALVSGPSYTANASFIPEEGDARLESLAGLAARFGLDVPAPSPAESPRFYAELLRSDAVLDRVVRTRFAEDGAAGDARGASAATLVERWEGGDDDPRERAERAVERLREHLDVSVEGQTGLVRIDVTTASPELSAGVAERLLEVLNELNLESRRGSAEAERRFIEERLREAERALGRAEDSLRAFLVSNRRFENSPDLAFEHDRLQRQVDFRQRIHTTLAEAYEEVRIEEVRSTPVITVLQEPTPPARPDPRGVLAYGFLGALLGGVSGACFAFVSDMLDRIRRDHPGAYLEYLRARTEAVSGLRGLRRALGRGRGAAAGDE